MMFRVRRSSNTPRRPTCCFCFHVRTGTICIGLWHLVAQTLMLSVFLAVVIRPELAYNKLQSFKDAITPSPPATFDFGGMKSDEKTDGSMEINNLEQKWIPFKKVELGGEEVSTASSQEFQYWNVEPSITTRDLHAGIAIMSCMVIITIMLVYGAIKKRAAYLLPFFCVQIFDLCLTLMSVVGYMSYTPGAWQNKWNNTGMALVRKITGSTDATDADSSWYCLMGVVAVLLLIFFKMYLIHIVWSCYSHLVQERRRRMLAESEVAHVEMDDMDDILTTVGPNGQVVLPPSYEQVTKDGGETKESLVSDGYNYYCVKDSEMKGAPPPAYSAA